MAVSNRDRSSFQGAGGCGTRKPTSVRLSAVPGANLLSDPAVSEAPTNAELLFVATFARLSRRKVGSCSGSGLLQMLVFSFMGRLSLAVLEEFKIGNACQHSRS